MIKTGSNRRRCGDVGRSSRNNNISIAQMSGDGFVDFIKNPLGWLRKRTLDGRPRILNELMKREGEQIITKIRVCREPVKSIIQKLINVFTFGIFKRAISKMNYDTVYHLYIVITLNNGNTYSLEKNERVNVIVGPKAGECLNMDYGRSSLNDFILNAEKREIPGFYRYDAFKDNCQKWIYDLMNSNGIEQFNNFILQDVSSLAPGLFKRFARGITDVAGVADFIKRGGSL